MPEKVDQVAKDAYDRGELGAEMYEKLVQAGLHDMREPGVSEWKDTAAANAEVPPPPPPVDDYVKDYVGEYIEVPAPPLSPPTEDSSMDDWQPKEAPAPACAVEEILPEVEVVEEYPVDGATEGVEVQGDRGKEQVAKEEREAAGKEEEEEDWKGQGFLWCFGCGRVDVVRYGNKALSDYFKGASMEVESGIVFILCGSCRGTPARSWQAKRSALAASAPKGSQEALGFQAAKHTLRAAIEDDLDDAVNVYTDAFKHGRTWQYGYLHDDEYVNYTW
ncbi:hypothetical protein B0A55_12695 [Friedmanniomyces simplex]|uniref:Uncharacterized protein n=1 Tax=Friedmanniomyces simplex TaxID=329884 RepID=A0A4U0WJB0_9PEZI|nr:hypothetical protein B0A55_12695 [Friedmanniomyces simplex]